MTTLHCRRPLGQQHTDTTMASGDVIAYGGRDWRVKYVHPLGNFWIGVRADSRVSQTEQTFWTFPQRGVAVAGQDRKAATR